MHGGENTCVMGMYVIHGPESSLCTKTQGFLFFVFFNHEGTSTAAALHTQEFSTRAEKREKK